MGQIADSFASLSGVRDIAQLAETVALELSAAMDTRDELLGLFGALQHALDHALSKAATLWNESHDLSRVLPIELQEMCFLPLTIRQKSRLALVSSSWRDVTSNMPALWNHIRLDLRKEVDLEAILQRSGQHPLALELVVARKSLSRTDQCFRRNAHRLRLLSVSLESDLAPGDTDDEDSSIRDTDSNIAPLFNDPTPLLEELSLDPTGYRDSVMTNFSSIFDGQAPKLRSIRVVWTTLSASPAFAHVTTATLRGCRDGLSNVFLDMPLLQHLELLSLDPRGFDALPALPAQSPLRTVRLHGSIRSMSRLDQLGYTRLTVLTVEANRDFPVIIDAAVLFMPPRHTPVSSSLELLLTRSVNLELQLGGRRTLRCSVHGDYAELQRLICDTAAGSVLGGLQRLILPRSLDYHPITVPRLPASLPGLRTLVVCCGEPSPSGLLSLEFLATPISVPALERVELVADTVHRYPATPIHAKAVVSFIQKRLQLDNRGSLELIVDTAHGVQLLGDLSHTPTQWLIRFSSGAGVCRCVHKEPPFGRINHWQHLLSAR